ncbi:MAG: MliC family protein [Alphaproteobacteria bacterium]|nr:MliC family protein [Alphaproteobacteria bacterium]
MLKIFMSVLMLATVAACEKTVDDVLVRQCGGYRVEMTFADDGDTMNANINGDALTLQRVTAASGAKYQGVLNDITVTLWGKGEEWSMFLNDEESFVCDAK